MRRALAVALVVALAPLARAEQVSPEEAARRLERAAKALDAELDDAQGRGDIDPRAVKEALHPIDGARVHEGALDIELDRALADEIEHLEEGSKEERLAKLERLSARARSLAREAARVHAARPAAPAAEPSPEAPERAVPDAARGRLEEVLSRPRFRKNDPASGGLQEKISNLLRRIENWWVRLLTPTTPGPSAPGPFSRFIAWLASLLPTTFVGLLAWIAVAAIAATSAILVYRKTRRGVAGAQSEPSRSSLEDVSAEDAAPDKPDEPADEASWRAQSRELAKQGDLRGALRAIYQVVLLALQRAGRIRLEKGRTNWEHVDDVRRRDPSLASKLEPLTVSFDLVWYGRRPIAREDLDRATSLVDAVAAEVSTTEGAVA